MKMVIGIVVNRLKALMLIILGLVKRSLCCFKRRRRLSCDSEPLTNVGVVSNYETKKKYDELQSWNTWEDPVSVVTDHTPNTVQHYIEMYRQQQVAQKVEEEPQTDFFQDMTPQITRQKKILVKNEFDKVSATEVSSRLTFTQDAVPLPDTELGCWEEREGTGSWEEAEQWNPEEMVREKRRLERERRLAEQAKKRTEREQLKTLGSRIS
ncbi:receptor-binding cancer antigen expressed on SiSo cells isoform X2 [Lycorma delicatula]|uniref:receptor-binding cancer antigen expressed on SiSo cells isoform X1 n=1 Tax=Lycorma delicatula TaxID=130591 RepID=UPI003F514E0A